MLRVAPIEQAYYYKGEQFMGKMPNGNYEPCDGSVDYAEIFQEELDKLKAKGEQL